MSAQAMALGAALAATAGWLVAWRTAYRLRPPLLRLGLANRVVDYLLIAWRGAVSVALVVVILWWLEQRSGRGRIDLALAELGLHGRLPTDEMGVLSLLLFSTCYAINLGFTLLRRALGHKQRFATANLLPQTFWETVAFSLVLSPAAGVCEEIFFRGFLQWAIAASTGDPISAIGSQAVLFGMVHIYQGGLGILRTFAVGAVLGAGTLACGSLIPAIVAHTLLDIASGIVRVAPPVRASAP